MNGEASPAISSLKVDGGAARNRILLQFQSDISSIPVIRPANTEATALGAAFLAGLAVGFFRDRRELAAIADAAETFTPAMVDDDRARLLDGWHRAVTACRAF